LAFAARILAATRISAVTACLFPYSVTSKHQLARINQILAHTEAIRPESAQVHSSLFDELSAWTYVGTIHSRQRCVS